MFCSEHSIHEACCGWWWPLTQLCCWCCVVWQVLLIHSQWALILILMDHKMGYKGGISVLPFGRLSLCTAWKSHWFPMIFDGQVAGLVKMEGLARLLLERIWKEINTSPSLPSPSSSDTAELHPSAISWCRRALGWAWAPGCSWTPLERYPDLAYTKSQFSCLPVRLSSFETPSWRKGK